ncbi:MAG: helix-turn-helix domain-containing protein [Actinomycetota bacterium]
MAPTLNDLLPVLAELSGDRGRDVPLREVAARVAMSPHHAQRTFRRLVGESPKQYQLRLRLETAAVRLVTTDDRVVDIGIECGFADHATFTRAFGRRFGRSPVAYRRRSAERSGPGEFSADPGACIGLYRTPTTRPTGPARPARSARPDRSGATRPSIQNGAPVPYDIEVTTLPETPILYTTRRVEHAEVADQLAEMLPDVFAYVMEAGLPMAGPPLVRHNQASPAFVTLDAAIPLATPADGPADRPHIVAGTLPAGPAAVTIHTGPYHTLG